MNYYELLDDLRAGDLIREDGRRHYRFVFGSFQWERTTLFQAYITENTPLTGKFRPVSEEQAQEKLMVQGRKLSQLLKKADTIAEEAHAGQVDKAGKPYIEHPRAVADSLTDWEEKIVALLHDVCEDTPWTVADLRRSGFTPKICAAVDLMTHRPEDSYGQYLTRLRNNRIARNVKLMDLSHNMDLDRIPNPTDKDRARVEKYRKARQFLYGDIPGFEEAVDAERPEKSLIPVMQIYQRIYPQALEGQKVPYGLSNPVLHQRNGQLCLAFFVYTYSRADLQKGELGRPVRWILADPVSGKLQENIPCSREDFSGASRAERFSTANPNGPVGAQQLAAAYARLDTVRQTMVQTGQPDRQEYQQYLDQMLTAVPPAYHRFYRELSI